MTNDSFEVRINRPLLLFFTLFGALFFRVGLDGAVYREWLEWDFPPGLSWQFLAFCFFFLFCGGLISLNCLWYLIVPPLMLRFDEKGVTFGIGLRYNPYTIPWKHVKSIGYGADISLTMKDQFFAGPQITFAEDPEVPPYKATSMGIGYAFRKLTLNWLYANRFPWTVVREGERLWKVFSERR
jgi:hypothetical protein